MLNSVCTGPPPGSAGDRVHQRVGAPADAPSTSSTPLGAGLRDDVRLARKRDDEQVVAQLRDGRSLPCLGTQPHHGRTHDHAGGAGEGNLQHLTAGVAGLVRHDLTATWVSLYTGIVPPESPRNGFTCAPKPAVSRDHRGVFQGIGGETGDVTR